MIRRFRRPMQLGMLEPKPRDVYYEDVYGRPDVDKDDVQDDMFDICESSSDGDDDDDSGNAIGESSTMIYQTVSSADLPYDANNDTIGQPVFKIAPSQNLKTSIKRRSLINEDRDILLTRRLGMFTDVPSGAISNTIDQSNHSERAFVEQHQEYPAVRRATSWKQQRSERIKQRRAVTEKARKSRNCLARRATKRVLDMRHTKERLAEESKAIEMPRDRAPSPYVLIGTEARATMGHEDRDEKGRAASPHVLIEPYRP